MNYKEQIKVNHRYSDYSCPDTKYIFLTVKWGKIKFLLTRELKELDFKECLSYLADLDLYLEFLNHEEFKKMCNPWKVVVEKNKLKKYMKRVFKNEIAVSKSKL